MKGIFKLIGDVQPNKEEIHLEAMGQSAHYFQNEFTHIVALGKLELYVEFTEYCNEFNLEPLHRTKFLEVWDQCFSHVKVREYKNVCGECQECAELSILRSSFRDSYRRRETTQLHVFHRATYMGEREVYYQHQKDAKESPDVLSNL